MKIYFRKSWIVNHENFLSTARRNGHRFPSEKEENATLIYKYKPTDVRDYMLVIQAYFF